MLPLARLTLQKMPLARLKTRLPARLTLRKMRLVPLKTLLHLLPMRLKMPPPVRLTRLKTLLLAQLIPQPMPQKMPLRAEKRNNLAVVSKKADLDVGFFLEFGVIAIKSGQFLLAAFNLLLRL